MSPFIDPILYSIAITMLVGTGVSLLGLIVVCAFLSWRAHQRTHRDRSGLVSSVAH